MPQSIGWFVNLYSSLFYNGLTVHLDQIRPQRQTVFFFSIVLTAKHDKEKTPQQVREISLCKIQSPFHSSPQLSRITDDVLSRAQITCMASLLHFCSRSSSGAVSNHENEQGRFLRGRERSAKSQSINDRQKTVFINT